MQQLPEYRYDVACALSRGRRDQQEDAIVADFPLGADLGFAVLADGMGGHAAGDVASKIIVTEVFSELKLQSGDPERFERNIPDILLEAAVSANHCISGHVSSNPESSGMGATLVAPVLVRNRMFWISVGDSPLWLFHDGKLRQLNEDHSMAPQIDFMVRTGLLAEDTGRNHPDRHCLTSVLIGEEIARIDCPREPTTLAPGDIVVVASDGLQTLSDAEIETILADHAHETSAEIARELMLAIEARDLPDQDNATFSVIRLQPFAQARRRAPLVTFSHGGLKASAPAPAPAPANGGLAASLAGRIAGRVLKPLQAVRARQDAGDQTA